MFSQFLFLSVCSHITMLVTGHILVYSKNTNQFIKEFYDIPAEFGKTIPPNGIKVSSVKASEFNACTRIADSPGPKYAVIIERGDCNFEVKVLNAQAAKFDVAIIYNSKNNEDLEPISAENGSGINISAVFVAYSTGISLINEYSNDDMILVINDELPFNINTQLILPFSILMGMCFLIMVFYMIYKCIREQRRLQQHRLPKNLLKRIPITKFTKGQPYEMCIICLEDFIEGDKLRILPCSHAYHSSCIDRWLTKNKRVCPICIRKVFAKGETRSNRRRQSSLVSITDIDDDTTPLMQHIETSAITDHGTFPNNREIDGETVSVAIDGDIQSSDDENVLLTNDSPSHSSQRVNPFDRLPNIPPNVVTLLNTDHSLWNYLKFRFLRRQSPNTLSVAAPTLGPGGDVLRSISEPSSSFHIPGLIPNINTGIIDGVPQASSNNILNPNLSGSFKDDDEMLEDHQTIYEPNASVVTPDLLDAIIMNNNRQQIQSQQQQQQNLNNDQDSIFIQTPSRGGIGVVALPNTNFQNPDYINPSRPPQRWRSYI